MVRRICPTCESTMNSRFYCRHCHRLVRNSYLKDINYYLNESHAPFEKDCEYHEAPAAGSAAPAHPVQIPARPAARPVPGQAVRPVSGQIVRPASRQPVRPVSTASVQEKSENYYRNREPGKGKSNDLRGFLIVAVLCTLALLKGLPILQNVLSGDFYQGDAMEYEVNSGYYVRELEDATVKAAGKNCSGRYHFDVKVEEIQAPVMGILASRGFEEERREHYSYNEEDGDGESWYVSDDYIYMTQAGDAGRSDMEPYIDFDYDTATGQMHGLYLGNLALTDSVDLAISLSDFMQEQDGFSAGGLVKTDIMAELARSGFYYREVGILSLSIDSSGGAFCYLTIVPAERVDG